MNLLQQHILRTLAYFDIFNYPLKNDEIQYFLAKKEVQDDIDAALTELINEKKVYQLSNFFSLQNDIGLAERRRNGNAKAIEEMKYAVKAAKILSRFPYVQGLAISGSLSKNFADENTDIDFFIITKANRLWIARTLMHLFYKLMKFSGKQRWFCMNYYIDEAAPVIEEQNIFTAMEIITLIPMQGRSALNNFSTANQWITDYFPAGGKNKQEASEISKSWVRIFVEKLFNNKIGNAVDNALMKVTANRWNKKAAKQLRNRKGNVLGMMAGKHYSKPDPNNFQQNVLEKYNSKVNALLNEKLSITKTDHATIMCY